MSSPLPLHLPDHHTEPECGNLPPDSLDTIIQTLFAAQLIADVLPDAIAHAPARGQEGLDELQRLIKSALGEAYSLQRELRPGALQTLRGAELLRHIAAHGLEDDRSADAA